MARPPSLRGSIALAESLNHEKWQGRMASAMNLSRYLKKKGISDLEFIKIITLVLMSTSIVGIGLYGAIGALL